MRIPSTSELVESQANKAYDKLAVISENLDKLEDIYEFIFNYYAFLKEKLSHYVPNDQDSIIKGVKEFHDEVKFLANTEFPKLVIPSQLAPEFKGAISCHYADNDGNVPALVLTCGDTQVAKICLGWNTETNKPILTIPDTDGDIDNSAVTVAYLKGITDSVITAVGDLKPRVEALDSRVQALEGLTIPPDLTQRVLALENALGLLKEGQTVTFDAQSFVNTQLSVNSQGCIRFVSCTCSDAFKQTTQYKNAKANFGKDKVLPAGTRILGKYLHISTMALQNYDDDSQYCIGQTGEIRNEASALSQPTLPGTWCLLGPLILSSYWGIVTAAIRIDNTKDTNNLSEGDNYFSAYWSDTDTLTGETIYKAPIPGEIYSGTELFASAVWSSSSNSNIPVGSIDSGTNFKCVVSDTDKYIGYNYKCIHPSELSGSTVDGTNTVLKSSIGLFLCISDSDTTE